MKVFLLLSIKRYRCYVTKRNMICKVAVFWVYQKYLKTACNWTCQKNWQALLGASLAVKPRMSFNKIKMQKLKRMFCMQIHFIEREDEFGNFCTSPLDGQYRKRRKNFFSISLSKLFNHQTLVRLMILEFCFGLEFK